MNGTERGLVSIIIPCFNAERFLREAIDSALAQTWQRTEIIVADDLSSDASVDIARSYGSAVQVLTTDVNAGPGVARNRGLAVARGEWIQFLDADDLLLPRKLEACIEAVRADDELPFSLTRNFVDAGGTERGWWRRRLTAPFRHAEVAFDPDDRVASVLGGRIQTHQWLHRRAVLDRVGHFRPEMRWQQDVDLNLRLALSGARFVRVEEVLVLCREHNAPGRHRLRPEALVQRLENEATMLATVEAAGALTPRIRKICAARIATAGRQAWRAGHRREAERAFTLARSVHPRPRVTGYPAYNLIANRLGLERTERLFDRLLRRTRGQD